LATAAQWFRRQLGIDEKDVQATIDQGKLTADQLTSIKQAELELQKQANELGLDFEKTRHR
jgi:hypothetical protein